MFQRIIMGLLFVVIGIVSIYFSSTIVDFVGEIKRAEDNIGGTRKLFVYLGLFICFIGFLYIFGVFGSGELENAMDSGFGSGY